MSWCFKSAPATAGMNAKVVSGFEAHHRGSKINEPQHPEKLVKIGRWCDRIVCRASMGVRRTPFPSHTPQVERRAAAVERWRWREEKV
jgi:hypothetical protein